MLHDLDVSGLSILRTLRTDTRRYAFENEIEMIDLGLRLEDVMACALEDEAVTHDNPDALGARRRILRISEAPRPVGWTAQMRARLHASTRPSGLAPINRSFPSASLARNGGL